MADDPTRMLSAPRARARLRALAIEDRGALAWQLMKSGEQPADCPRALLLLALGGCAGWLGETAIDHWLARLAAVSEGRTPADEDDPWPRGRAAIWRARALLAPMPEAEGDSACDWPEVALFLTRTWAITDRSELIRMLLWLGGQGHRYGWDLDYRRIRRMTSAERLKWRAGLGENEDYGRVLLQFVGRDETPDWAAWDWLRLIDLACAGWLMGWLEEQEAVDFAVHGMDLLLQRHDDWAGMLAAWQRGASLFEGRDLTTETDARAELLLHGRHTPWQHPPAALVDETMLAASRERIRQWRSGARHWVLAVAGVRDPDLFYRQGMAAPADDQRRREARRYLQETLDWWPQEGVSAISRYWLPGQAHHLNQLASDAAHRTLAPADTPFGRPSREWLTVRGQLAECREHAATIVMAERFGFQLAMLEDGDVGEEEVQQRLQRSFAGVLGRLYATPERLLQAWLAWERVLPEDPDASLADDLEWHLNDPGSPFHWLEYLAGEWQEPGPRPTLEQFTALALSGPLNTPNWGMPQMQQNRQTGELRDWLDSHYGLGSATALRDFLDFLSEAGDRQEYQITYAPYTLNLPRLREEIAIMETGQCSEEDQVHLDRLRRVRDNDQQCNDLDMAAWDIAQLADLCVAGRQLGWLDEDAMNHYLERALALARQHYGDWRAYARGLYAGYSFFMMGVPERHRLLEELRSALMMWLCGTPPLAGAWASLDFPGAAPGHWPALHVDVLSQDRSILH
ncbi:YbeU/YbeR family protein [Kushneria sinocarnis]|nr:YbeU/YbeR family protein [Kushneria sinocarnis]